MVPTFALRERPGFYSLRYDEPVVVDQLSEAEREDVPLTTLYMKILEDAISESPDQWLWYHDRWKQLRLAKDSGVNRRHPDFGLWHGVAWGLVVACCSVSTWAATSLPPPRGWGTDRATSAHYYDAARATLEGESPYSVRGFLYPPPALLPVLPLARSTKRRLAGGGSGSLSCCFGGLHSGCGGGWMVGPARRWRSHWCGRLTGTWPRIWCSARSTRCC